MSCGCNANPCGCEPETLETCRPKTKCDRYVPGSANVWVERGDSPNDVNAPGICMLDTLCDDQIIYILEHDNRARRDLVAITSDPHLLELAAEVPRLPTPEQNDIEQAQTNQPHGSIPFYSVFRGQPPFAQ